MKNVCIAGGFDPIHRGHIDHIQKAAKLGDILTVILSTDEQLIKKKGWCLLPYDDRFEILMAIKDVTTVVRNIDKDGSCAKTLLKVKPDIFAKGGDRVPKNMPGSEIMACKEIGCEIEYKVGDLLGSSTGHVQNLLEKLVSKY